MAAFPLAFAKKRFGLNLKSANTKTAGANKVLNLESRKGVHKLQLTSVDKLATISLNFLMNERRLDIC